MKINLNIAIKDLDGNEIPSANLGKLIAQALISATEGDALKQHEWAHKLHAGLELDLDNSDTEALKSFINNHKGITTLVKAPALKAFIVTAWK